MKVLDRKALKIIAVIAMTMDHLAPVLFSSDSFWFVTFRFIGRLTLPIMAYMLADGFRYTRNLKKYLLRMLIFSIISYFTFSFLETGSFLPVRLINGNVDDYAYSFLYLPSIDKTLCICKFSIITNFLLALLVLAVWERTKYGSITKIGLTLLMLIISLDCDWGMLPILLALTFYYLKGNKVMKWSLYAVISVTYIFNILQPFNLIDLSSYFDVKFMLYRTGMILAPIVIELFYNGEKGKTSSFDKWFFYIYYPAHQVILGIINLLV